MNQTTLTKFLVWAFGAPVLDMIAIVFGFLIAAIFVAAVLKLFDFLYVR